MMEINCLNSDGEFVSRLTQWDIGQSLVIRGTNLKAAPDFHFCNKKSPEALIVPSVISNEDIIVKVPNILLQESLTIMVYMYVYENTESAKTAHIFRIPVTERKKPSDYTYVENIDRITLSLIDQKIADILEKTDLFTPVEAGYLAGVTSPIQNQLDHKRDYYKITIELLGRAYDPNKYYPVTGTPLPEDGLHLLKACAHPNGSLTPPWCTNANGFECVFEMLDSKNAYGMCTISYARYTQGGTNPCGYVQMRNSGTPVMILRGGGRYHLYTDYPCEWTPRQGVYTVNGETVRPNNARVFQFEKTALSANLDGNATTASRLSTGATFNGLIFDGSTGVHNYCECSTASGTAVKTVSLNGIQAREGTEIRVKFLNGNTAENPSLQVNGSSPAAIYYRGVNVPARYIAVNALLHLTYCGNHWEISDDMTTQADWNQTDTNSSDFIKNKPNVKTGSNKFSVDAGYRCSASGIASFTEGSETEATQSAAHAEGFQTKALGQGAHSEGVSCIAGNNASHAEGIGNQANGTGSHAEGYLTRTQGTASHSEGYGTVAQSSTQHAGGRFNVIDSEEKYAYIVGNGSSDSQRSNIWTLRWNGDTEFAGDVIAKGCGNAEPVSLIETDNKCTELRNLIYQTEAGQQQEQIEILNGALWKKHITYPVNGEIWERDENDQSVNMVQSDANYQCTSIGDLPEGAKVKIKLYYKNGAPHPVFLSTYDKDAATYRYILCNMALKEGVHEYLITIPSGCNGLRINSYDKRECDIEIYRLSYEKSTPVYMISFVDKFLDGVSIIYKYNDMMATIFIKGVFSGTLDAWESCLLTTLPEKVRPPHKVYTRVVGNFAIEIFEDGRVILRDSTHESVSFKEYEIEAAITYLL